MVQATHPHDAAHGAPVVLAGHREVLGRHHHLVHAIVHLALEHVLVSGRVMVQPWVEVRPKPLLVVGCFGQLDALQPAHALTVLPRSLEPGLQLRQSLGVVVLQVDRVTTEHLVAPELGVPAEIYISMIL
jgi:hypothetical protein